MSLIKAGKILVNNIEKTDLNDTSKSTDSTRVLKTRLMNDNQPASNSHWRAHKGGKISTFHADMLSSDE